MLYPVTIGKARYPGAEAFGSGIPVYIARQTNIVWPAVWHWPPGFAERDDFFKNGRTSCGPILGKLQ
jgi:hypothetical protein